MISIQDSPLSPFDIDESNRMFLFAVGAHEFTYQSFHLSYDLKDPVESTFSPEEYVEEYGTSILSKSSTRLKAVYLPFQSRMCNAVENDTLLS